MGAYFDWQSSPPKQILIERFHITTGFHPGQQEIIEQLVQGKRVLAIQRTGWGKSLCYQMASLYYPNLTLVFSPLKALMRDQCQRCNDTYTIAAAIVSSDFTDDENKLTLTKAIAGDLKILFIAPERLVNNDWQKYVLQMRISMVVIDEAHCISTWGHDFRPDYRRILQSLKTLYNSTDIPILALTATANSRVEQDICCQMGKDVQIIRGSMQRPNLHIQVVRVSSDWEKLCYLAEVLSHRQDTGIIYTATQRSAEMVALFLNSCGIKAEYYHAGRENSTRQDIEQKWMVNQYTAICTTTALGMGIDKRDVRFVIHYHVSASLIQYYQEIGRAGRDGNPSWCILLYNSEDLAIQQHLIQHNRPDEESYTSFLLTLQKQPQGMREKDLLLATGLSRSALRTMIADLEDQGFVQGDVRRRTYSLINNVFSDSQQPLFPQLDFSAYEASKKQKLQELYDVRRYAEGHYCYMASLVQYVGDSMQYGCGTCSVCRRENFPPVQPTERTQARVTSFLDEEYIPSIEQRSNEDGIVHLSGWSLSFHGMTTISKLVYMSKYADGGPFALSLVLRAVEVVQHRYPLQALNGVVSIPSTKSGWLVEAFARQVADMLHLEYLPLLVKTRRTQKQKALTNRTQKAANVKDAFALTIPEPILCRTLLLVDDIYDSGYTMREAGRILMQAGAVAIYPLTITRTVHSDDQ